MKYYIFKEFLSLKRRFFVKNENNEDVFEISSDLFGIEPKTTISDKFGNTISYAIKKAFNIMPCYKIYLKNNNTCKITKKFQLLKNNYLLDNGYRVEGNFLQSNYTIYDSTNRIVGTFFNDFKYERHKYEINIFVEDEIDIVLSIVAVILNNIYGYEKRGNKKIN